jgi:hypothetical protein
MHEIGWCGNTNGRLPELEEDGKIVAVFRDPDGNAVHVPPEDVAEHLRDELKKYEWNEKLLGPEPSAG